MGRSGPSATGRLWRLLQLGMLVVALIAPGAIAPSGRAVGAPAAVLDPPTFAEHVDFPEDDARSSRGNRQPIDGTTATAVLSPGPPSLLRIAAERLLNASLQPNGSIGTLGPTVPPSIRRWEPLILAASIAYGVDPNLIAAVMMTESGGNPNATSPRGAVGLMQVLGGSYDPATNVTQGVQILADNLRRFGGDLELALAAYNAGASTVMAYQGIPPYLETENYVFEVLNRYYLYTPSRDDHPTPRS